MASRERDIINNIIKGVVVAPLQGAREMASDSAAIWRAVGVGVGRRAGKKLAEEAILRGGPVIESIASHAAEVVHDLRLVVRRNR